MPSSEEYCLFSTGELVDQKVYLHDYQTLFSIPGLYECVYFDLLRGQGPRIVASLLSETIQNLGDKQQAQRVLDVGAGSGLGGQYLRQNGFNCICGVDINRSARDAAFRDRPKAYDRYYIGDVEQLAEDVADSLRSEAFTCATFISSVGPGHIPASGIRQVMSLLAPNSWVAVSVRENLLPNAEWTGLFDAANVRICARQRYVNRLTVNGQEVNDVCIVLRTNS